MSFMHRHPSAAAPRLRSGLKPSLRVLALLALCALAPAAFLIGKEGSPSPAPRSARVSLVGLDLSTPDGARDARERIRKAARDLCARNPSQRSPERSFDYCVDDVIAAAQRQLRARTTQVSLADLDLSTAEGIQAARDRLQTTARRVCQELPSNQYSACVDETFANALRQTDLLQRISDLRAHSADTACVERNRHLGTTVLLGEGAQACPGGAR
jgi:UrcA family protein